MTRTSWIPLVLLVAACGSDPKTVTSSNPGPVAEESSDGGAEETGSPQTDPTSGTTAAPDPIEGTGSSSGGGEASTGCSFLACGDDMQKGGECDQWSQDCPDGQKCSAYADDGGNSWNNTKCVAVMENAGTPGDECTVEGSGVSGVDSCEKGAMCWGVDPDTNKGTCIALCEGTPEAPSCEMGANCAIANDVLNLCLPGCDPLAQDCVGGDVCIPSGQGFLCVIDASGEEGQAFDPCEFANVCDAGLYCMDPGYGKECDPAAGGCCLPFCDLDASSCPGDGQECLPWFDEGTAPPDYEKVGICGVKM